MRIIYTHTDFDGVVSASLLSIATGIDFIKFVSASRIWYERFTGEEIVCDLPCPWHCKLWFDHHETNLNEMKARGVEIDNIPGKFELSPSCAQIIFEFFHTKVKFPSYFESLIKETNKIDSMDYNSIEEWRKETPAKILATTCQFLGNEDYKKFVNYLIKLAKELRKHPPEVIIQYPEVKSRYNLTKTEEEISIQTIEKNCYFHPLDKERDIIIIDTSEYKVPPRIDKNLAYLLHPTASCVFLINSIIKNNQKTNNLKLSVGINFTKKDIIARKNLAAIFENLGIGGGHKSAAGAIIECRTKEEKLKTKEKLIERFIKMWKQQ